MQALIGEPSSADPEIDFALGGLDFRGDIGNARLLGDIPFNVFAQAISRGRINLNITRRPHATVYASSTCRPFELAAAGAAIVSSPQDGMDRWFDVGAEVRVVSNADEALATYRELLEDPGAAEAIGRRARERVLDEHTYAHRARQILELVGIATPVGAHG
jgi:spore maturation protein CgeB